MAKHTNLIRLQSWEWRNQVQNLVMEGFTKNKKNHICGFYREKGNPKIEYYHWLSDAEVNEFLSCNETVPEWSYAEQNNWLNKKFDIDPEEEAVKKALTAESNHMKGILYFNPMYNYVTFPIYIVPMETGGHPIKLTVTSDSQFPSYSVAFVLPVK